MRATALLISMAGVAAGMTLTAPPVASAAGVYGGTTRAGEAIVFKTDRAGRQVRSAVMAVVTTCQDGRSYPITANVTAVRRSPGFDPGPRDLIMRRNRAGRFAGTVILGHRLRGGEYVSFVSIEVAGRLSRASASGTLSVGVVIVDAASGDELTTCSGRVRWTASRAAGRIFGGATSQGEPFVARLDARGRWVEDVYVGWRSQECDPGGGIVRRGEAFGNFRVDRRGRWGHRWDHDMVFDAGATASYSFHVHGSLGRRSARGTLAVGFERQDAAGVVDLACHSGTLTWKAATG